mmetsp:Transcript_26090/g.71568  ORF Transcript_26090/g.71568 Transcript_26090/m.71568 type:complete len:86 (-) Transcript_26090:1039-1296(-)
MPRAYFCPTKRMNCRNDIDNRLYYVYYCEIFTKFNSYTSHGGNTSARIHYTSDCFDLHCYDNEVDPVITSKTIYFSTTSPIFVAS